ncbi:fimbrillin family protein [Phocaeicola barnesiae]|nr:fimbrillin family protein [Phocaeicola barnesiae]MDM8258163.1 fimbrillin family protein [Phocaeicola barnesiae]
MGNRLPLHILSAATVLLLAATACTQDDLGGGMLPEGEYPLVIRATGLQAVATPASTRATVDGDWQGVQTVALSVGGTVKEYDVTASDADGYKTAILSSDTDPFWWTSREDITVSAWWPYGTTMPDVVVKGDQSTKEGFEGSDFISAKAQTVQFDHPMLEFSHRTARITVLLKPGDGITSVTGADVSVTGLGTDNGNPATIRTYAAGSDTYEALTAPQTVKVNTPFIQVDLGGGTYYFRPQSDVVLEAGCRYTYTVSVTAKGLELAGCTIGGWTDGGSESGNATDLGDGYTVSEDGNTYTVYTDDGLMAWAEAAQGNPSLNCTLTHDIDLSGTEWEPIGVRNNVYTGTFDGNGHTIRNMAITKKNLSFEDDCGMFGRVGTNATIQDLTLEDVRLDVDADDVSIGALAGSNQGIISNCRVSGNISVTNNKMGFVGGVVGRMESGVIQYCHSSASIQGGNSDYVGGVLGGEFLTKTVIKGCSFSGSVTGGNTVGGIAGYCRFFADMTGCYSVGELSSAVYNTGGITGYLQFAGVAGSCYWYGFDGESVGRCNETDPFSGAYKIDGTTHTWQTATEAMNTALGADSEYIWETTDADTPPTLVKNR